MQLPSFKKPIYKPFSFLIGFTVLIIIVLHLAVQLNLFWLLIPITLWIAITAYGVFSIQSGVFLTCTNKVSTTKNQIALTFDDGPHPNTAAILDILKKHQARATFFLTGKNVEKYPELAKRIVEEGHAIGNHSYSHLNTFPVFSTAKMIEDISKASILIKRVTGKQPKLFRPPFGVTNPRIAKAVHKLNLNTIGWSVRSLDTQIDEPGKVTKRIQKRIKAGSIILLHDYTEHAAEVLERILTYKLSKNYNFTTFKY